MGLTLLLRTTGVPLGVPIRLLVFTAALISACSNEQLPALPDSERSIGSIAINGSVEPIVLRTDAGDWVRFEVQALDQAGLPMAGVTVSTGLEDVTQYETEV